MKNVILLPTYNEAKNIEITINGIFKLYPEIYILVIDDNSPDKTGLIVKDLMGKYKNLSILERREKNGLGEAYKEGIKKVIKDKEARAVITMDADGSHSPEYIKNFLEEIKNYDLIIGSRYVKGGGVENWERWREKLSRFGNIYADLIIGIAIKDLTAGFVCVRRELLEKIDFDKIDSSGYAYQIEFKYYCSNGLNARIKEIPIIFKSRRDGESKISKKIIFEGIIAPWKMRFKK